MPQQKQTEGFEGLDHEEMEKASPEEREFALLICQGRTASDAFRAAFDAENYSQNALWVEASRRKNAPKVRLWIDAYRLAGVSRGARTLDQHLDRLTELSVKAELSGNYGAAVNAEHHCGKASGLYVDKVEDVTPARTEIADKLAELLGPDMAGKLLSRTADSEHDDA